MLLVDVPQRFVSDAVQGGNLQLLGLYKGLQGTEVPFHLLAPISEMDHNGLLRPERIVEGQHSLGL